MFGAAREVTGACISVITKAKEKVLIDCGMFQGGKERVMENYQDFGFDPKEYDALLLTHAHLDHCGRIPKLVKEGFDGVIYAVDAAKDLAEVVMLDAAKVAAEDTYHKNQIRAEQGLPPREPIYTEIDVKKTMKLFVGIKYDKEIRITKDITAKFYDAGHILGASSIQLKIVEGKETKFVVFSGDIGQANAILVKNIEPIAKADYVFIESTYGDRIHPPIEQRKKEFIRIVNEAYKKKGKLMIPAFAVERTQELLYYLGEFMRQGLIPKMKVYLDSPMAIRATDVFEKYLDYYNDAVEKTREIRGDPFNFPQLVYTSSVPESKMINQEKGPFIVIAGNGMCSAGRIKHHIMLNISNPDNTLMFIGYQVPGTLGYWIKKGEKRIKIFGREIDVNAKIEFIEGFSAHADSHDLFAWLNNYSPKPKKVFLIHGEENQMIAFSEKLEKEGFSVGIPFYNEPIKL